MDGINAADLHRESYLEFFANSAALIQNCGSTPEGIAICYHCEPDTLRPEHCINQPGRGSSRDGRLISDAGFDLRDNQNLKGDEQLPWAASCGAGFDVGSWFCDTAYAITEHLGLRYDFGPLGLDLNTLRQTDLAVQQAILSLRAPQFDK